jgi:Ca2+-binding RTX toxin-like protein
VLGGAGIDNIATGRGDDVILGDHGKATFVTSGTTPTSVGSIVFSNDGILTTITTTQPEIGANDIITGSDGFNVIVGGLGADQITGGANRDIVIGDNGRANFDNTGVLVLIESTDAALGGDSIDNIIVGNGPDIVIGGNGADNIQAAGDISDDIVIGDNGKATFDSTNGVSVLRDIISTDPDLGDNDTINTGDGYNIVIGGFGIDGITGGAHTDVILGDNGHAVFNADGVLTFITTTSPAIGNGDVITFGAGGNTVFGGAGADTLTGLEGTDVIVGDNGNATFTDTGLLTFITTSDVTIGAADIISTGAGFNTVLGGFGKDNITGGVNTDVIIGDHGNATFDPSSGESIIRDIISTETTDGDDDIITVGDGFNVIIGGFGADQVNGGAGDDVILGDNGHAVFNTTGILTYITTIEPTVGGNDIIKVGDGSNTVLSGLGADEITGGLNGDVVIGDNGNATFTNAGVLTYITTTEPTIGSDDIIKVSDGFNVILAGFGADQVTGGADRDVVLGDNGNATFTNAGVLTYITTTEPTIGNDDTIITGAGDNIVIGGFGADKVTGGANRDVVLGDNGNATFTTAGILTYITTTEPTIGNDDVIITGDGDNIIIGGFGSDQITGGADRDVVLGDNGNATFTTAGVLIFITTTEPTIGSDDTIVTGNGFNIILAGIGGDSVTGGTGRDVILGDNGNATFDSTGGQSILRDIISTETDIGGADIIDGGSGNNIIIGGTVNDTVTTGGGDDIVLGDSGHAVFNAAEILTYITVITPGIGGDDIISVGDGFNIVLGGFGKDTITGGNGVDLVLGDNGYATFDDLGVLTYLTTTDHTIGDDDRIFTLGGDDLIFGGTANDFIDSGSGNDSVFGDFGYYSLEKLNDPYVLNPRGAVLLEEETGGNDTIFGGSGEDLIYGEGGNDIIDAQEGDDTVVAGYGDDEIHGGDGNDILMGGPGGDFFDSGWGADTLYVDLYDGWNGGMPQDTIMGGPFFSTNTQLALGLPVLGGGSSTTSFDVSITATQLSIIIGDGEGGGYQLTVDVPSSILVPNPVQMSFSINFNDLRWGGSGSSFALLALGEIHATLLLGIGEFLEVLWSDLMALING